MLLLLNLDWQCILLALESFLMPLPRLLHHVPDPRGALAVSHRTVDPLSAPLQGRDVSLEHAQASNDLAELGLVLLQLLAGLLSEEAELVAALLHCGVEVVSLGPEAALAHMIEPAELLVEPRGVELVVGVVLLHEVEVDLGREQKVAVVVEDEVEAGLQRHLLTKQQVDLLQLMAIVHLNLVQLSLPQREVRLHEGGEVVVQGAVEAVAERRALREHEELIRVCHVHISDVLRLHGSTWALSIQVLSHMEWQCRGEVARLNGRMLDFSIRGLTIVRLRHGGVELALILGLKALLGSKKFGLAPQLFRRDDIVQELAAQLLNEGTH